MNFEIFVKICQKILRKNHLGKKITLKNKNKKNVLKDSAL